MIKRDNKKSKAKIPELMEITTFYTTDRKGGRDLFTRTVLVDPAKMICVVPGYYPYLYGEVMPIETPSARRTRYTDSIPAGDWVNVRFGVNIEYQMFTSDFRREFGMEPPKLLSRTKYESDRNFN